MYQYMYNIGLHSLIINEHTFTLFFLISFLCLYFLYKVISNNL